MANLFSGFVAWLATWLTQRLAVRLAAAAVFITLAGAFMASVAGLAAAISVVVPEYLEVGLSWFMPDNLEECASTWAAALLARRLYEFEVSILRFKGTV